MVHFIGGAFFGAVPQWSYRQFLGGLAKSGFWVIATPLPTSFDHLELVTKATADFEAAYGALLAAELIDHSLPVVGVGHSMGALLSALASFEGVEQYRHRLKAQVLISYNSQSLSGAVPLWKELWTREELRPSFGDIAKELDSAAANGARDVAGLALDAATWLARSVGLEGGATVLGGRDRATDLLAPALDQLPPLLRDVAGGVDDFQPGGESLCERISAGYPRELPVLLVRFENDPIDQTLELERLLKEPPALPPASGALGYEAPADASTQDGGAADNVQVETPQPAVAPSPAIPDSIARATPVKGVNPVTPLPAEAAQPVNEPSPTAVAEAGGASPVKAAVPPVSDDMGEAPALPPPPRKVELKGTHMSPAFNELPDLIDGTDALGRLALDVQMPTDALLETFDKELSELGAAVLEFARSSTSEQDAGPSAPTQLPPRWRLGGLCADDFRHPLDRRQTRALEVLPGLGAAVRRLAGLIEEAVYQDNVSSSVLVGERQYAWVYKLLTNACDILDIADSQRPEVYVRQNPVPNAYTLAVRGKRPFIVIHTALLDRFCEAEVEAVIAHELGHLKCEHGTWLTAANVLLLGATLLPLPARVLGPFVEQVEGALEAWQRAAELTCDRASLLVAQEPWTPLSVMVKLSGGGAGSALASGKPEVLPRESLEAFLAQADTYDTARREAGMLNGMITAAVRGGRPRTHPIPVLRAREMWRWAGSEQFWSIVRDRGVLDVPRAPGSPDSQASA